MFRKIISLAVCCSLGTCVLAGCSSAEAVNKNDRKKIVCTVFSAYDWVKEIIGENTADFEITYLLGNGSDMHSYQPTMDDMVKISSCDLFIYIGGESDQWAESAVKQAKNKNMKAISLLDSLGSHAKTEEYKKGMEYDDDENSEPEFDEHIWLSLGNAEILCGAVADAISDIDPYNSAEYSANLDTYTEKLQALDSDYKSALSDVKEKTLIFGDRFPFRYLTDDYGLDYYAVFSGCSAETEASFETITFIADKINELGTENIFTIEGSDFSVAEAIISATESKNQNIITLDSIQSVTEKQAENGTSYLSVMRENLDVLKEVLN
ncbi:MAG: metal ABC transporter substrate-binding protein [Ruminococcus sp.]|nr:metal ABC transporter substrate-binding protein [Ruminococcus sp.]